MKIKGLMQVLVFGNLFVAAGYSLSAQTIDPPVVAPQTAQEPVIDTPVVTNGVLLQGGAGNFEAPMTDHGFSLSMNGGVGLTAPKSVPGYDAFTIDSRWVLGTNNIGRRLALSFGAANWYVPALASVYSDTVLTPDERNVAASTTGSVMAGFAIRLLCDREVSDEEFKAIQPELEQLGKRYEQAGENTLAQRSIGKEMEQKLWKLIRKASREPVWTIGAAFRLVNVTGDQADIDTYDLYSSFAAGKKRCDFVVATHYLRPLQKDLLLKDAFTLRSGLFIDLDDDPPVNTLGFTMGIGWYQFQEKQLLRPGMDPLAEQPHAERYDITVTFSNLFKTGDLLGTGLAVRYAWTMQKDRPTQRQFAILLNTAIFKDKKKQ